MLDKNATKKEQEVYNLAKKTYNGKRPLDCVNFSFCDDIKETCGKSDKYSPCYLICNKQCESFKKGV